MIKRLGIFGGAFDPVHKGHTQSLKYITDLKIIDEIQVIPNYASPHNKEIQTDEKHRLKMLEIAFKEIKNLLNNFKLKKNCDAIFIDLHGEAASEKQAFANMVDGKVTAVLGTHTHVPTSDLRILPYGTAFQTDTGMCGDYDSVIGMNKDNSINRFMKKDSVKHFPAKGEASLSGVIVDCNIETGLAIKIKSYIFGGCLNNTN